MVVYQVVCTLNNHIRLMNMNVYKYLYSKIPISKLSENKVLVSRKHECPTLPEEPEGDDFEDPAFKPMRPVGVSLFYFSLQNYLISQVWDWWPHN